jgi:hypothetical protein
MSFETFLAENIRSITDIIHLVLSEEKIILASF